MGSAKALGTGERAIDGSGGFAHEAMYRDRKEGQEEEMKEEDPKESVRELYFVRMPKPDFDTTTVQRLEQEFEEKLETVQRLTETLRVGRLNKDECRNKKIRALREVRAAQQCVRAKQEELQSLRDASRRGIEAGRKLCETRYWFDFLTEEDLNKAVAGIEYGLENESVSQSEEKSLMAQIKKLQAQRPKAREFERNTSSAASIKMSQNVLICLEQGEKELKVLREEEAARWVSLQEVDRDEKRSDEALNESLRERDAALDAKNQIYERLKAARASRRERMSEWLTNRYFSKRVRALAASGRVEDAARVCAQQTDLAMSRLTSDDSYRTEYLRLCEAQRKTSARGSTADAASAGRSEAGAQVVAVLAKVNAELAAGRGQKPFKDGGKKRETPNGTTRGLVHAANEGRIERDGLREGLEGKPAKKRQQKQEERLQAAGKDEKKGEGEDEGADGDEDDGFMLPPAAMARLKAPFDKSALARRVLEDERWIQKALAPDSRHRGKTATTKDVAAIETVGLKKSSTIAMSVAAAAAAASDAFKGRQGGGWRVVTLKVTSLATARLKALQGDDSWTLRGETKMPKAAAGHGGPRGPIGKAAALLGRYQGWGAIGGVLLVVVVTVAGMAAL